MKFKIACLLIAGLLGSCICNVVPQNSDEKAARAFLQEVSSRMFKQIDGVNEIFVQSQNPNSSEEGNQASKNFFNTMMKKVEIVNESKQFDVSKFTDPELSYIFKKIRQSAREGILGEEKIVQYFYSLNMLEELSSDKDILSYRNESVQMAFFPDVQDVFAKSDDPEELKYYWTSWREKNGAWAISNFVSLIELIEEAANLTEISPLEFWLQNYNVTEMKHVLKQIRPLYSQLHAFIRNRLHKKYGDSVIKPNGPIPHHLFEQVLAQAWTPGSIIEDQYPHKNLPPYDEILRQRNHPISYMYQLASEFYTSLGFNLLSHEYFESHIKMKKDEDAGDCKANIFDQSPNVYMFYCQKMDFRKFLQAHGYMARVHYAKEKTELPAYYFSSHNLEYPVGEAVILSASTPKHLNAIGLLDENDFVFTEDVKMNRLLRMGIHTLLNLPVYYVHTKVMSDLFAGDVDLKNLNKRYWKLMDKYAGVAPPTDRGDNAYDFPFKFYMELTNNKQAEKFMTEVLGYQFYERLCQISGQFSRTSPSEPINNCDFYRSKEVGNALKKMMRLGSSKSMSEVLATIFPENPSVSGESLIEYYAPMKNWLESVNREEKARLGWVRSDKKISKIAVLEESEEVE